ncbi:hypothetical protein ONZ45_g5038 [Pleurotus djamor]|nr:hypothetical protein ONZ45_g5038 [Pleurotus djamor]
MLNTYSLPSLVTLSLAASYKPWCLPENLLDPPACVPKLERLVLNNCTLNLRTPRFRFLRALEVEFGYGDRDRNMLVIFDMIEYLSNLEDVWLKNVTYQVNYRGGVDARSFVRRRGLRTFVFPRLRSLEIQNNSATPVFYLSCVSAPAISRVVLSNCALHYPTEIEPLYTFASFNFTSPMCEDAYIHDLAIPKKAADGDFYHDGYLTLEHNQYRSSDNTLVKTLPY